MSDEDVINPIKGRSLLRKIGWLVIVVGVAAGLHFTIQAIIRSGDASLREGPDMSAILQQLDAENPAQAALVRAGMEKYNSICRLCHHRSGHGGKFTPPISGKSEEAVTVLLRLYRDGVQMGPMTNLMAPWAKDLSDEDISILSAYVATLK